MFQKELSAIIWVDRAGIFAIRADFIPEPDQTMPWYHRNFKKSCLKQPVEGR